MFIHIYNFINILIIPISFILLIKMFYRQKNRSEISKDGYQRVISSEGVFFIKSTEDNKIITKKGNIADIPNRGLTVEEFNEQLVKIYLND